MGRCCSGRDYLASLRVHFVAKVICSMTSEEDPVPTSDGKEMPAPITVAACEVLAAGRAFVCGQFFAVSINAAANVAAR